jgi:multiple sugar transport system substrate-binding protein
MAWDHPRATLPLRAVSARWSGRHGIDVHWEARPPKDFEDQPLEQLADRYDLVLIDHPFTGTAATSGLIRAVNDWVQADYLDDQRQHTVGPSYRSYTWDDAQWALAMDAACQVSAVRDDLWAARGDAPLPATWDAVLHRATQPESDKRDIAVPLNPNHAYCAFVSVGVGLTGDTFWPHGKFIDDAAGLAALTFLAELAKHLHPASRDADPIDLSDRMAEQDEVAYVPLMFGYSSYARDGFRRHPLRFADAPLGVSGRRGSVLCGVGIALSARTAQPEAAADLARVLAAGDTQSGLYVEAGGQPGHAAAWDSANANRLTRDFFSATRDTMAQSFLRPRVPGHRAFQPAAGERIHGYLWHGQGTAAKCLDDIRRLHERHLSDWGDLEAPA